MSIALSILGATGSIGTSTLSVVDENPDQFKIIALSAHSQVGELVKLCVKYQPKYACIAQSQLEPELKAALISQQLDEIKVLSGEESLSYLAQLPENDRVMSALVGAVGMRPTLAAIRAGKTVLLANKEALVLAGELMMREAKEHNATIIPVDSEHNAIFQSLPQDSFSEGVTRIILTASGGPFRNTAIDQFENITPEQACNHPNWSMGRKISVDSATMMNKGLEVIEACWLFGIQAQNIEVLIHPQSIVHSMVRYIDGSIIAQLGEPDMRTPIAYALTWPKRIKSGVEHLDFAKSPALTFEHPDYQRFPCLKLAFDALAIGGNACARLNAANEVAVEAFLNQEISFNDIAKINKTVLKESDPKPMCDVDSIIASDYEARIQARLLVSENYL